MVGIRQFDEDKLLADALDLFRRKGLRATSMLDLAAATGIQRGSLYNAFGDKEELFLRAFDRYATRFVETAQKSLNAADARTALTAFLDSAIANMTDGMPPHGCLTTRTATETDLIGDAVRERIRELLDSVEAILESALTRHRHQLNLTPEATAQLVVTFTRGLAVMERVHGDRRRLQRNADALVETLVAKA